MKKIRIFFPPEEINFWHIDLPFRIEENFQIVSSIYEADFLAFTSLNEETFIQYYGIAQKNKINFLRCWYTHNTEIDNLDTSQDYFIYESLINKIDISNANISFIPQIIHIFNAIDDVTKKFEKNIIFYDYMFNRQKLYFTEIDEKFEELKLAYNRRIWTGGCKKERFRLNDISKKNKPEKKFLAANRNFDYLNSHPHDYYNRHKLRTFLVDFVNQNKSSFFYSDWKDSQNVNFLHSEEAVDENFELEKYYQNTFKENDIYFQGWNPIANFYYEKSFISVFVESLVHQTEVKTISEKTFDPLIKGHFILPFGYPKMIDDLKNFGFLLPDFIDYSYDKNEYQIERFEAFIEELKRLNSFDLKWFEQRYEENKFILEHNKKLFYERPYDSLYKKLKHYK